MSSKINISLNRGSCSPQSDILRASLDLRSLRLFLLISVCNCIIMCAYERSNFNTTITNLKLPGVRKVCGEFLDRSPRPRFLI